MKNLKLAFLTVFSALLAFSSCQKENLTDELMTENQTIENSNNGLSENRSLEGDETLIVLSAPSVYNNYYADVFDDIIDYQANFANSIEGKDKVVILADAETLPYFDGKVSEDILLEANIEDIWIRDFAPAKPSLGTKFNYLPDYQSASTSNWIDNSFEDWFLDEAGLTYGKKSNLILDGGNIVDNDDNRVIVTNRILRDNPQLTKKQAKNKLKKLLGVTQVAIIPEAPGDATGHADGMVMWATDNKILLHEMPKKKQNRAIKEMKNAFPGVEIVVVPDYYKDETWQGFSSACNIFVNSTVTDNYIYMPTFDAGHDAEMLEIFEAHTDKEVVTIPAESVCFMGGSVRCLSWQVKGDNADIILDLAAE